jgi:alpha-tubulin suppressor-like RCC1 family protein
VPLLIAPSSSPATTVTFSSPNVLATITPVTCNTGSTTVQYQINSRTNDGSWAGWTAWSTTTTATQTANDGVKYGYQAQARCYVDASHYSSTVTGTESTYIDPIAAPAAPVVAAVSDATTTTWSWGAVTCAAGTTANYQYDYFIDNVSQAPSGWKTPTDPAALSIQFTTSTSGHTYKLQTQADCFNNNAVSGWGATSNSVSYYRSRTWTQIATSGSHTCAIASTDSKLYCWGQNDYGQLGLGNTTSPVLTPTAVIANGALNGLTILSVDVGFNHTCVVASDHKAYCWGRNDYGQLGINNVTTPISSPTAVYTAGVLSGKTILSLATGGHHTCVIANDNFAYCWGYNNYGEVGDNTLVNKSVPTLVNNTSGISSLYNKTISKLSAGNYDTCVVDTLGKAHCWGDDTFGQVGNNSTSPYQIKAAVAVNVVSGTSSLYNKTVTDISSNGFFTCALDSLGAVHCWGEGDMGHIGNNAVTNPIKVPNLVNTTNGVSSLYNKTVTKIAQNGSCAISSDNLVHCWGDNSSGQVGDNTVTQRNAPVLIYTSGVLSGKTITSISAAYASACVITSTNNAYCWGMNTYGQLGDGTTTSPRSAPVLVQ